MHNLSPEGSLILKIGVSKIGSLIEGSIQGIVQKVPTNSMEENPIFGRDYFIIMIQEDMYFVTKARIVCDKEISCLVVIKSGLTISMNAGGFSIRFFKKDLLAQQWFLINKEMILKQNPDLFQVEASAVTQDSDVEYKNGRFVGGPYILEEIAKLQVPIEFAL